LTDVPQFRIFTRRSEKFPLNNNNKSNNNNEFIERYFQCYPIALYNNFKNVTNKIDKNVKISET